MTNELNIQGSFSLGIQGVAAGANVTLHQVLGNSADYQKLERELNVNKKLLSRTPETEAEERRALIETIQLLERQIKEFENDVRRLAEQFERIDVNTERLGQAKELFGRGELAEARKILRDDLEKMYEEQKLLTTRRKEYEDEILPKLKHNSEEFMTLAMLSVTEYENENRLRAAKEFFESSLASLETKENLFQYGSLFLGTGEFLESARYYDKYWKKFSFELDEKENIEIHINLGVLSTQLCHYEEAESHLNQVLALLNRESAKSLADYKVYHFKTLYNLGCNYLNQVKTEPAREKFFEALPDIQRAAAADSRNFDPLLAETKNFIGFSWFLDEKYKEAETAFLEARQVIKDFQTKNDLSLAQTFLLNTIHLARTYRFTGRSEEAVKHFERALQIIEAYHRELPALMLPTRCIVLNSLGLMAAADNDTAKAQKFFEAALAAIAEFFAREPQVYFENYCMCLANVASVYQTQNINRELSINCAARAMAILYPVVENLPAVQEYYVMARDVLANWGLGPEEIDAEVEKIINEMRTTGRQK